MEVSRSFAAKFWCSRWQEKPSMKKGRNLSALRRLSRRSFDTWYCSGWDLDAKSRPSRTTIDELNQLRKLVVTGIAVKLRTARNIKQDLGDILHVRQHRDRVQTFLNNDPQSTLFVLVLSVDKIRVFEQARNLPVR